MNPFPVFFEGTADAFGLEYSGSVENERLFKRINQ
jgi:hypothetical protein